jgi:lysine-N-methylase
MWRQDGLCRIQADLGVDALCQVCRDFPRLRHDYGDFVELGLELSCPEAARLMLTSPRHPMSETELSGGEAPEYEEASMDILLSSRQQALEILEAYPLQTAMQLLLLFSYRVQDLLDGGEPVAWNAKEDLHLAAQLAHPAAPAQLLEFYTQLEILTPRWKQLLAAPLSPAFPEEIKNLLHCGIQRYWLQAISDLDLVCRVKMLLAGSLLVGFLGGDPIQTAQLYSKEIDNSAENVNSILDAAYTHPALTDRYLLGLMEYAKSV